MTVDMVRDISAYADQEKRFLNVVVDIPKGSSNKFEYNEDGGYFTLDRVLHHQMFYPFDYGFIPQTLEEDGDPVDVILLVTYPTFTGCVVKSRIIGIIETSDEEGKDHKVICVPISKVDPRWDHINSVDDLNSHMREELLLHFKEIKKLEKHKYDKVQIWGFKEIEHAYNIIDSSIVAYHNKH
jgi:inorganic pyrophosphatase